MKHYKFNRITKEKMPINYLFFEPVNLTDSRLDIIKSGSVNNSFYTSKKYCYNFYKPISKIF